MLRVGDLKLVERQGRNVAHRCLNFSPNHSIVIVAASWFWDVAPAEGVGV